jgi:hypothetical protein
MRSLMICTPHQILFRWQNWGEWDGRECSICKEERKGVYGFLVGKTEVNSPLGRSRPTWEGTINMAFQELGWLSMDCIDLAQDRDRRRALVDAVMNFRIP